MSTDQWEVLYEVEGTFQAEILRGLLESQGIDVFLSQEGAGHSAFAVTVGALGQVQILVPSSQLAQAQEVLRDYNAGVFEDTEPFDTSSEPEETNE